MPYCELWVVRVCLCLVFLLFSVLQFGIEGGRNRKGIWDGFRKLGLTYIYLWSIGERSSK